MRRILDSNSEEVVRGAVGLLVKVAANIIAHPMEEKYRKIKASSAALSSKVLAAQGGAECLRALGFTEERGEEWVLHPSAERWEALVAARAKLEAFQNAMQAAPSPPPASGPAAMPALAPRVAAAAPSPSASSSSSAVGSAAAPSAEDVLAMRELLQGLMAIQEHPPQP
jgi:ubiquilin